jgi:hypothetical protein
MTLPRRMRSVHPVPVCLTGPGVRQVSVPDLITPLYQCDPLGLDGILRMIEEAELYFRSMLGEEREVCSLPIPGCAQWRGLAGPDSGQDSLSKAGPRRGRIRCRITGSGLRGPASVFKEIDEAGDSGPGRARESRQRA